MGFFHEIDMPGLQMKIYPAGKGRKVYRGIADDPQKATFEDLGRYLECAFDLDYWSHIYRFVLGKQLYDPASFIEKNSSDMKCAIGRFALPQSFRLRCGFFVCDYHYGR